MMKTCPKCKEEKPDSSYYKNPTTGKLASYCKPCKKDWDSDRRKSHRKEYNARQREWRKANPDKARQAAYKWRSANPDGWKSVCDRWATKNRSAYEQKRRQMIRDEAFAAYGGYICACCGEDEPMFQTIDHIDNDGAEHRRELGGRGGSGFFAWLRSHNYPKGFQVLCRNCNWGKHANGGVCPHHKS